MHALTELGIQIMCLSNTSFEMQNQS